MSVAFLHVHVNLPIPLYGTLLSVIIASPVRHLPCGMRYAYAGVLQIHIDLEDAATTSDAGRAFIFLRVVLPLIAPMDVLHAGGEHCLPCRHAAL
jgi:iron(III) transport system permease protein